MRFAVRRPAVPRGHRPSEGGLPAVRDGHLIPASDRPWHSDGRALPVATPGRRTLARFLIAPADDGGTDPDGSRDLGAYAPAALPGTPGVAVAAASRGSGAPTLRACRAPDGLLAPVPAASTPAAPATAYGPPTLHPTRVLPGRPAACHAEPTVPHLGETTAGLLARHVVEGRPAGARRAALDTPSAVPEIPRRERRPLPGRPAGALTSRVR